MTIETSIADRLAFALEISEEAARLVLGHFQDQALQVQWKADRTPVTVADRAAEKLLRDELLCRFPTDAVLGEEYGETDGSSGFRWILDPIDGTRSFIHGVPLFGMLIGLEHAGTTAAGICRLPAVGEVVYAHRGGGAWWRRADGAPVAARVSTVTSLSDALLCYTAVEGFAQAGRVDALPAFASACRLTRGWGDCYGHMLVATGRAEVMVDPLLAEWDAAALAPILEEAGGVFMTWQGESSIRGGNGISTTSRLRDEVLRISRSAPEAS